MKSKKSGGASGPLTYSHVRVKEENYGEATGGRGHHFNRDEVLTMSGESEMVGEAQIQPATAIHSRGRYSVFYSHRVRRTNTKKRKRFRNNAVKQFKYLPVSVEKGTMVERDGRFSDDLCIFILSDKETSKTLFSFNYFLRGRPMLNGTLMKHGTYSISCDRPCTVLEALKSSQIFNDLKWSHEKLVIQLGAQCGEVTLPTHFTFINCGVFLEISHESEVVEVQDKSGDKYSVFYINILFKNNAVERFKCMCVYRETWTIVEEALKKDGCFSDDLYNFTYQKIWFECTQKVYKLHGKHFKICLPKNKTANDKRPVVYIGYHRKFSVRAAVEINDNTENIYELLDQSRFSYNSYQKALGLGKENVVKISECSELKLQTSARSVCKVIVKDVGEGSGFVLFDNFILTNAHLFKGCVEEDTLKKGVEVCVLFNYDDPELDTNYCYFEVVNSYICLKEDGLDYAVLELNTEGPRVSNLNTQTQEMIKIPPGLLKDVGPMPESGAACLIGHPGGKCKQFDPTCIIEKEKRGQAVYDHLYPYIDRFFTLLSIIYLIREQGIENIMPGGKLEEKRVTYKTSMYHGSSGSPVFDAQGKVFGLHTGGFEYGFPKHEESVIEFAQPLCTILKDFVNMLKTKGLEELLKRFKEAAKGNSEIQKVLESVSEEQVVQAESADFGNCSDTSEPMDIS